MAKANNSTPAPKAPSSLRDLLDEMEDDVLTVRDLCLALCQLTDGRGDCSAEQSQAINRLAHLAAERAGIAAEKRTAAYKLALGVAS